MPDARLVRPSGTCPIAKGVVILETQRGDAGCHECGQGPDQHEYPVYRVGSTVNGAGAVAWLGMGMPARWPDA